MLLLRKLDHLSTEESIFTAVSSLQGVYRTLLIRDKMTKMSCEFAFVEFIDTQVKRTSSFSITLYLRWVNSNNRVLH
jgi:hypothetical protein